LKAAKGEWISLEELSQLLRKYGLSGEAVDDVTGFLKDYFLEVDEESGKVRLDSRLFGLFKIPVT